MGDYNASFWGPEQNKIEKKLRKQNTPNFRTSLDCIKTKSDFLGTILFSTHHLMVQL